MKFFLMLMVAALLAVVTVCMGCSGSQRPDWEYDDDEMPCCCPCCDDDDKTDSKK